MELLLVVKKGITLVNLRSVFTLMSPCLFLIVLGLMVWSYSQRTAHNNAQTQRANIKEIKVSFVAVAIHCATSLLQLWLPLTTLL